MKRFSLITLAVLAAGSAHAQVTKQGNGYLLRYKFTKGAVTKYTMNIVAKMGDQKQANPGQKMSFTMTVLSVKGNTATIKIKGNGPGGAMDETITMDNQGRAVGKQAGAAAQIAMVGLPTQAVAVGGTWKSNVSANMPQGGGAMKSDNTFKLVRVGSMNGRNTAEIAVTGKITGFAPMTVTGKYNMLVSDGSLFSMNMVTSGSFANPNSKESKPMKFSATTTLVRG